MRDLFVVLLFCCTACNGGSVAVWDSGTPPPSRADAGSGGLDPELFGRDGALFPDLAPPAPDQGSPQQQPDASPTPQPYGTCQSPCSGATHVLYSPKVNKWVQVVLCSPQRYDIFVGEQQSGPFYKVGDTAGHGQDHCELVNPSFTLSHEDMVDSGNCPTCKVQGAGSVQNIPWLWNKQMYWRANMGQPLTFGIAQKGSIHTSCWYECGVSF